MTSETLMKILLTGATGYIGGSVLTNLIYSTDPKLSRTSITCLVRGEDRISKLKQTYGDRVNPVLYRDLDDLERTVEFASQHDVVISTTLGYHPESAAALVRGLAKRRQSTGRDVWMIHTSGTSNLADQPISKRYVEDVPGRVFDDSRDDIYSYELMRNKLHEHHQRTAELGVIDTGLSLGVRTLVLMPPTIYGVGTGLFNRSSVQIPSYARATLANGRAIVVGDGRGTNGNVHVEDLAELYKLCLLNIVSEGGKDLPTGKRGIIFAESALHQRRNIAQGVADAAYEFGFITNLHVKSVSLEEGARLLTDGDLVLAELGFSSNSRTRATVAREKLGWKSTRGLEAWKTGFMEEIENAQNASQQRVINFGKVK